MTDTPYTEGFRAGLEWEKARIIKLLEDWLNDDYADFGDTLKLIKGEAK